MAAVSVDGIVQNGPTTPVTDAEARGSYKLNTRIDVEDKRLLNCNAVDVNQATLQQRPPRLRSGDTSPADQPVGTTRTTGRSNTPC